MWLFLLGALVKQLPPAPPPQKKSKVQKILEAEF